MAANPSTRWYFNDWMLDPGLRACSVPARGLWMDCLAICAGAKRRGYLEIEGKPCSVGDLARITGAPRSNVARWLAELEANGVFSRDADGTIYNRRMVREGVPKPRPKMRHAKRTGQQRGPDQDVTPAKEAPPRLQASQDLPSCSNIESVAAPEPKKDKGKNPLGRCAPLCRRPDPLTPLRKRLLAEKHCRYLRARRPFPELVAYWEARESGGETFQREFDRVDKMMRGERWDDRRQWKDWRNPPPLSAVGETADVLMMQQGWYHGRATG
jgi:hypothetical protein